MKVITVSVLLLLVAGCSPSAREKDYPVLPEELKNCKIYRISDGFNPLYVVKCPNSNTSTTYQSGKTQIGVSVIEDYSVSGSTKDISTN